MTISASGINTEAKVGSQLLGSSVGRTETVSRVQQPNWFGRVLFNQDAFSKENG